LFAHSQRCQDAIAFLRGELCLQFLDALEVAIAIIKEIIPCRFTLSEFSLELLYLLN
jgi:hypothetical protein